MFQDKINQDMDQNTTRTSYNPLVLLQLIKIMILAQTEYQYPFGTVYNQELTPYMFHQCSMSNPQWYGHFNTKIDGYYSIGVTRQQKSLLEYVAQEAHSLDFDSCTEEQQAAVLIDSTQRYLSYKLLIQSGSQHIKLEVYLKNDFTTGNNIYPKYRPQTIHILENTARQLYPK